MNQKLIGVLILTVLKVRWGSNISRCKSSYKEISYVETASSPAFDVWENLNSVAFIFNISCHELKNVSLRTDSCHSNLAQELLSYTNVSTIKDAPLCVSKKCRITGTGVEFTGKVDETALGNKCQSWNRNWKTKKIVNNNNITMALKYYEKYFPDSILSNYKCRNPNGDLAGNEP